MRRVRQSKIPYHCPDAATVRIGVLDHVSHHPGAQLRPTLIYDGDCGICKEWVTYWEGLTGTRVVYRPYQDAAQDYPDIPLDTFRHAIQFVETDAHVYSGAAATYRGPALRARTARMVVDLRLRSGVCAPWRSGPTRSARRRDLLSRVTRLLWGTALEAERYDAVIWVFLRGLGFIYFAAFASLAAQILRAGRQRRRAAVQSFLQAAREYYGIAAYGIVPTLFWLNSRATPPW